MALVYILGLLLTLLVIQISTARAKVPAIIVFGDSTVDSGNNNRISTVMKSNFRPYGRDFKGSRPTGRFCNGRLPSDFISEAFGLKHTVPAYLDPRFNISDFATGVCFASAGTGYDNATSNVFNVIPLWKELEYFKGYKDKLRAYAGDAKAKEIVTEALYLLSLGTNDFLENYYVLPRRRVQFSVKQYQDFLIGASANFIRELYALGARKVSLTGVPPMGCLPLERAKNLLGHNDCEAKYNKVGLEFNSKLASLVPKLNRELPGMKLVLSDAYEIIHQIIQKPSFYGFQVAGKACCSTGMFEMSYLCNQMNPFTCKDPSKYVFWDAFHPTEKTNKIISDHIIPNLLATFA